VADSIPTIAPVRSAARAPRAATRPPCRRAAWWSRGASYRASGFVPPSAAGGLSHAQPAAERPVSPWGRPELFWIEAVAECKRLQWNLSRHQKIFSRSVFHTMATPLMGQNQILPRFRGRDMKQFLNFTLPPYRGVHHGGISLWPCSSRRQVSRHGRQPGGANASVGGSSLAMGFVPTPWLDFGAKR